MPAPKELARRRQASPTAPHLLPPVRLRTISLDLDPVELAEARSLLTENEEDHAARGDAATARRRIALRAGLRVLLGEVLALSPAVVPLEMCPGGRPRTLHPALDISCSRSGNLGLVAVAFDRRVGVDLEQIDPWRDEPLDPAWLSALELSALADLDASARAVAAARCWTRKEALLKGRGTGLTAGMTRIETRLGPGSCRVDGWTIRSARVPAGFVASVATARSPHEPRVRIRAPRSTECP